MVTKLSHNGKTFELHPSREMGGGIDGWVIINQQTGYSETHELAHHATPEEEWHKLSPYGKASIRLRGWRILANRKEALSHVVGLLTEGYEDRCILKQQIDTKVEFRREDTNQLYKELVTLGDSKYSRDNIERLSQEIERIASLFEIMEAIDDYSDYVERQALWESWRLPEPTEEELVEIEKQTSHEN